jgi:hypothetical protein
VTDLEKLIARLAGMSAEEKDKLWEEIENHPDAGGQLVPTYGPQLDAYNSEADVLLYGGMAGGGKSALAILLALTKHKRSLIMRRQYTDIHSLVEDFLNKHGTRKGYSGAPPAKLRTEDGRLTVFGAAKQVGDEESWRGQPFDLLFLDEASQFEERQFDFLMGWNRSDVPGQKCRAVLATNPPDSPVMGQWLIQRFGPWLDPTHELYPTPFGELRWSIRDEVGELKWVDGPEEIDGVKPKSYTFIQASLSDNPFLGEQYKINLDNTPEPLRSAIRDGNWMLSHEDDRFQVIPTNNIMMAQERWTADPPDSRPQTAIGVDVAQGGVDDTVLARRHDFWFDELICVPGRETPTGSEVAALVMKYRLHQSEIIMDMGGGYGEGPAMRLKDNGIAVKGFKGAVTSTARTKDRQWGFYNKRSEAWWKFREALDPDQPGGSPVMLPAADFKLRAELAAPRFMIGSRGVQVESKEEVIKRLGRSTDRADAVIMAWSHGANYQTHGEQWRRRVKNVHKVVRSHMNKRRK